MAEPPKQEGLDLDWSGLAQWMEQSGMPKAMELMKQPKMIEGYVKDMISNAVPTAGAWPIMNKQPRYKCFDTHHFVFVKFKLGSSTKPEELRLFVRPDRIKLRLPGGKYEEVALSSIVLPDSCRALCKEGILQVKLRKRPLTTEYKEAPIRW